MKTLVVYYSLDGNTKEAAERVAAELGGDLLQLIPVKDNPKTGFPKFFIGGMKASMELGTKLHPYAVNTAEYEQVILCTPVWASKPTPAINQFLKSCKVTSNITGAVLFSGSGDAEKCIQTLKKKVPGLKYTVSLADRSNKKLAPENANKLTEFINSLK